MALAGIPADEFATLFQELAGETICSFDFADCGRSPVSLKIQDVGNVTSIESVYALSIVTDTEQFVIFGYAQGFQKVVSGTGQILVFVDDHVLVRMLVFAFAHVLCS